MEKTRTSLLQRIAIFFGSFTKNNEDQEIVNDDKLNPVEQEILKALKDMDKTGDIERKILMDAVKVEQKTGRPILTKNKVGQQGSGKSTGAKKKEIKGIADREIGD